MGEVTHIADGGTSSAGSLGIAPEKSRSKGGGAKDEPADSDDADFEEEVPSTTRKVRLQSRRGTQERFERLPLEVQVRKMCGKLRWMRCSMLSPMIEARRVWRTSWRCFMTSFGASPVLLLDRPRSREAQVRKSVD